MTYRVFGIGEVLWDLLPSGPQMGGAPANFAYHARVLGADAQIISRVGNDRLGTEIIQRLAALNVPTGGISVDPDHPTGTVTVELAADGQPHYTIHEGVAWDFLQPSPVLLEEMERADAVCFGSLAQRSGISCDAIRALVAKVPSESLRVFDINLRQNFYSREIIQESLQLANVMKLNDVELPIVAKLLGISGSEREQLAELVKRYNLRLIAYTRGANGSVLYDGEHWHEHPGLKTVVKDTIGAGDSFTAAITLGLLAGWSVEKLSQVGNEIAAYVCTCAGGTPPLPEHLRAYFQ